MNKLSNPQILAIQNDFSHQIESGNGGTINLYFNKMLSKGYAFDDVLYSISFATYVRIDKSYESNRMKVNIDLYELCAEAEMILKSNYPIG